MASPHQQIIYQQNSRIEDLPAESLTKIFPTPSYYKETGKVIYLSNVQKIHTDPAFAGEAAYLSAELGSIMGRKFPGGQCYRRYQRWHLIPAKPICPQKLMRSA